VNRSRAATDNYNQDGELNAGVKKGDFNYQPSARTDVNDASAHKYSRLPLTGTDLLPAFSTVTV